MYVITKEHYVEYTVYWFIRKYTSLQRNTRNIFFGGLTSLILTLYTLSILLYNSVTWTLFEARHLAYRTLLK